MSRFLFAYDPDHTGYDDTRILILDRGPEAGPKPMRGEQLRKEGQAAVLAVCTHENTAKRIISALEAVPGDEVVAPDEVPF